YAALQSSPGLFFLFYKQRQVLTLSRRRRFFFLFFFFLGRGRRRIVQLARDHLLFDGGRRFFLGFLVDGHVLILGVLQHQIQRLAFDNFSGQGIEQVFFLEPGTNAARRLLVLNRDALDLVVEIVIIHVQLLFLGNFLHHKMFLQRQRRATERVLLQQALASN